MAAAASKFAARMDGGSDARGDGGDRGGTDDESVASAPSAAPYSPGDGIGIEGAGEDPLPLRPGLRDSVGSRSYGSLQDLAASSPDGPRPRRSGSGASGDGSGGAVVAGGVEGNRPRASSRHRRPGQAASTADVGLRRRGMSTTDEAVFGTRSSVGGGASSSNRKRSAGVSIGSGVGGVGGVGRGGGGGGRARAWTGGEEVALNTGGGGGGGSAGNSAGASASGVVGSPFGRSGERSRGGLQRISPLWDTEADGSISQIPVPFDRAGRSWSRKFNVDAAQTGGPLETSGATLGVSVSALTGQFHRTRVVTLYPRLVVRNFLGFPLEVSAVFFFFRFVCWCVCEL